ncbi:hypothetical protein CEXT_759141 [Caerostris extrusa]|uniref:Uncharacterized protein n=1 Tax=Caerostris extrusa TaxID=172846 RepID=A0AAV4YC21_CAEEX|nr:hypothetical protein CEXT_759141 [Caerostris extrusa]
MKYDLLTSTFVHDTHPVEKPFNDILLGELSVLHKSRRRKKNSRLKAVDPNNAVKKGIGRESGNGVLCDESEEVFNI